MCSFLHVQDVVRLDTAIGGWSESNSMKAEFFDTLNGLRSPAFDNYAYDSLKGLLWGVRRKIDLRDFVINRQKDYRFGNVLYWASRVDRVDVVKLLVTRSRMDINAPRSNGSTPASVAADSGNLLCLQILVEDGQCDCLQADDVGMIPLHRAVNSGHEDVVTYLLNEGGANVDSKDIFGNTPMHFAANRKNEGMLRLLLRHGGSPNIVNMKGLSVIDMALERQLSHELVAYMQAHLVPYETSFLTQGGIDTVIDNCM